MNESKWRIHKDQRFNNRWVIHAPGDLVRAAFMARSWDRCMYMLPSVQYLYARNGRR